MYSDQDWKFQPDLEPGKLETEYNNRNIAGNGYMHKECCEAVAAALRNEVRSE